MVPVVLRIAVPGDEDELIPMMLDFNVSESITLDPAVLRRALSQLLADQSLGLVWFIETGPAADTAGYLVVTFGFDLEFGGRDAFLTELFVQPEARGCGAGAAALAIMEEQVRVLGAGAVHLMVRPENEPAVRLYARTGFIEPPRRLLSKRLSPIADP